MEKLEWDQIASTITPIIKCAEPLSVQIPLLSSLMSKLSHASNELLTNVAKGKDDLTDRMIICYLARVIFEECIDAMLKHANLAKETLALGYIHAKRSHCNS